MKIGFTTENKTARGPDFPKLHLDHGQTSRICLVDAEPEMLYVHTFKMPVVEDGKIVTKVRQGTGGRPDSQETVTEFVAQFRCHGDPTVVQKDEIDPKGCEGCAQVEQNPEMFDPPRRRFAQHVLQYETKPGGFAVQTPFQAKLLVWVYAEGRFNALVDFATEHGDLRKIDLMLGPCENKNFQKFDIKVGAKCEWLTDDARKQFVKDLYANNQCGDLEGMIARQNAGLTIKNDASKVRQRWSLVGGSSLADTSEVLGADVLEAVSGVVEAPAASEAAPEAEPEAPAAAEEAPAAPAAESTEEEKPEKKPEAAKVEEFDFASILDGI